MPVEPRSLPSRPSLRYLKLEAKRRLAEGEFSALHDAHVAIAREYGLPSWAALKQLIGSQTGPESHALAQLRWVVSRFRDAGRPGWAAPGEPEMRQHFADRFLTAFPPGRLITGIASVAGDLRHELVVVDQAPLHARIQIAGLEYVAVAEADPPHRLTGLQGYPRGGRITDRRTADPPSRFVGDVPDGVARIADESFAELGLAGLVLAGGAPGAATWVLAQGWADLDRGETLDAAHRFRAVGVSALVATTALLRLIAGGRVGLDAPANDYLRAVRLADGAITVREVLRHIAGIANPAGSELFADEVPDLAAVTGPVIACDGPRGKVRPSNGGCAVIGQVVADVTGVPFAEAATRLVLNPLGMSASSFPARPADIGPRAVTGYRVTRDGVFAPMARRMCTIPAAGGLWATPADLVRLATGWSSLLPGPLAREALTPWPGTPGEISMGLGWLFGPTGDTAIQAGAGPDSAASLHIRLRDGRTHVVLINRLIPVGPIDQRLLQAWTSPTA
jgi:CubicO group peptidase (beta-lactamase class C family)